MSDDLLSRRYKAPTGGWERLEAKMNEAHIDDNNELIVWRNMVAALVLGFLLIPIHSVFKSESQCFINLNEPALAEVILAQGQAIAVPQNIPGVRFYWLFMDEAEASSNDLEEPKESLHQDIKTSY
ncbi:MAG: hypothetical protein HRT44_03910 [Bdellovibrionales bacterium]|nr:hypothetical protein [Bdellovibrionales bacterium]NQZ18389.1 hypothetical protein [Bdellovibrionales bacterium]